MEEEKKQQSQQEEKEQDKKKYTLKVVITTVIATLLLIAILLLCVLFGLKNCSGHSKDNTSSELPIDTEKNNKITEVFKDIVYKHLVANGYDDDYLTKINAISYVDNYPNNFTLDITVKSNSKLYYYSASDVNYKDIDGNKDSYSNLVSYLKLDKSDYLDGDISLLSEPISDIHITTTKQGKWAIGVNTSNEYHLSGYYLEDNIFHIYNKRVINIEEDPFSGTEDYLVKSNDLLYNYYLGLTI